MMMSEVITAGVTAVATIIVAWLALKGANRTAHASRAASSEQTKTDAQDSALQAWQNLLQPHIDEVSRLRGDIAKERKDRADEHAAMQKRLDQQDERIEFLTIQLKHWKRLAKVMARWATTLRDQVLTLGGTVPATPEELLLIQSLDDED